MSRSAALYRPAGMIFDLKKEPFCTTSALEENMHVLLEVGEIGRRVEALGAETVLAAKSDAIDGSAPIGKELPTSLDIAPRLSEVDGAHVANFLIIINAMLCACIYRAKSRK